MKQITRTRSNEEPKDEDRPKEHQGDVIGEIRIINKGSTVGGSFRSLKKAQ